MSRKFSQTFHSEDCRFGFLPDGLGEMHFCIKDKEDKQADIQRFKDSCDFSVMKSYLYQNALMGHTADYPIGVRDMDFSAEPNQIKTYVDYMSNIFDSLSEEAKLGAKNPIEFLKKIKEVNFEKISKDNKTNDTNISNSQEGNNGGGEQ